MYLDLICKNIYILSQFIIQVQFINLISKHTRFMNTITLLLLYYWF